MFEDRQILLTGVTGQVGKELLHNLTSMGHVIAPGRQQVDLADIETNFKNLREKIRRIRPSWIINAAAYTAVDKAESESELAYAINRDAVRAIGEEAEAVGAAVIHFSTDYVFDGLGDRAYWETDRTNPVSAYGASKLAGEQELARTGAAHLIFRTSWVYGTSGKNFLLTILKLAKEREIVQVVSDQVGSPTWSRDLANMTQAVMQYCETKGGQLTDTVRSVGGVYHASGSGTTSWFGFATQAIALERQRRPETRFAEVQAITTDEYPTAARRPANSRMNCEKLMKQFGWKMMDWQDSLQEVLSEL